MCLLMCVRYLAQGPLGTMKIQRINNSKHPEFHPMPFQPAHAYKYSSYTEMFSPSRIYHTFRACKIQTWRQQLLFSLEFLLYRVTYHILVCSLLPSPGICREAAVNTHRYKHSHTCVH